MRNLSKKELFKKARPIYEDYVRACNDLDDYADACAADFEPFASELKVRGLEKEFLEYFAKGER
jgi:hypothetical protein